MSTSRTTDQHPTDLARRHAQEKVSLVATLLFVALACVAAQVLAASAGLGLWGIWAAGVLAAVFVGTLRTLPSRIAKATAADLDAVRGLHQ